MIIPDTHGFSLLLQKAMLLMCSIKQFKLQVENQYRCYIQIVQCDNGSEFQPFNTYGSEQRFKVQFSCPYTSAQNGHIERKHRHIVETSLALLAQARMPLHFLWEAFHTTIYLINWMSSSTIRNLTPFYLLKQMHHDLLPVPTSLPVAQVQFSHWKMYLHRI